LSFQNNKEEQHEFGFWFLFNPPGANIEATRSGRKSCSRRNVGGVGRHGDEMGLTTSGIRETICFA
jgi:hypothetical protein